MVGHHHLHHVLGAALRHVAGGAVVRRDRRHGRSRGHLFETAVVDLVTLQAGGAVVGRALLFGNLAVRVVTGEAAHLSRAALEAGALLETVGLMVDLEAVAAVAISLYDVHLHQVVGERLPGTEGVGGASEMAPARDRYGGLHVALVADVVAQPGLEAARVDDDGEELLEIDGLAQRGARVLRPGSVAALAAQPLGELFGVDVGPPHTRRFRRALRDRRCGRTAFATDLPRQPEMLRAVEARRHAPALSLAVPGDGQLVELALRGAVEVGPGVVAGAPPGPSRPPARRRGSARRLRRSDGVS